MTVELKMLLASVILLMLQILPYFLGRFATWKLEDFGGDRLQTPPVPPWVQRAERAEKNMATNLVHFAALVLIVQAAGLNDEATALGAQIFFYARVAYTLIYIAGIPYLRTLAWSTAIGGEILMIARLLAAP
ncbi:MAG: MAPEG family protein [Leptospirales bacterium]|jgi:uncharacterized MAPEG superfamily protein